VADRVYTEAQAQKGEATFRSVCAACHTVGDFSGDTFLRRWPTVGSLFDVISTTMPQDLPASLSPQQYAEVIAFILKGNNFPAGESELPEEVEPLNAISMQPPRR
jgi:mono/diheme cytochrome c family protein